MLFRNIILFAMFLRFSKAFKYSRPMAPSFHRSQNSFRTLTTVHGKGGSKKITINPNWKDDYDEAALKNAFDKMAAGEGVDISKMETFNLPSDFDLGDGDFDDDSEFPEYLDDDDDFEDDSGVEVIDFGGVGGGSMDDRITRARDSLAKGYVTSVDDSEKLDEWAVSNNMPSIDEVEFEPSSFQSTGMKLTLNCPGCGVKFQSKDEMDVGFLPPNKLDELKDQIEIQAAVSDGEGEQEDGWTTEDEIEWLLQGGESTGPEEIGMDGADSASPSSPISPTSSFVEPYKPPVCQRCHGLKNFGRAPEHLTSSDPTKTLLTPATFKSILTQALTPKVLRTNVVVIMVDLFDFTTKGALETIDSIIGDNKANVILGVNKSDLFPRNTLTPLRAESWVRRELRESGIQCVKGESGDVRLISALTGFGVESLVRKVYGMLESFELDGVYVIGGANVGKSTLLNKMMGGKRGKGKATESQLPGTTLNILKFPLKDGKYLYDTPGLLVPGSITTLLSTDELKIVCPKKRVEAKTFRVEPGGCVMLGGLARVDVHPDCKPFLLTFFVGNEVSLHPTKTEKSEQLLERQLGKMLTPPLIEEDNADMRMERLEKLGGSEEYIYTIHGKGWKEAAADLTIRGLGWFSVTGAGDAKIKVTVPKGTDVTMRADSLMPRDVWQNTGKFTGHKMIKKGKPQKGRNPKPRKKKAN
mmetsp:Transcript_20230/g.42399  ORF Transcript_20230/g.42399 Transcript_20230/m.42399 type:complete len:698 (-) Transcript_20230:3-2096(-)